MTRTLSSRANSVWSPSGRSWLFLELALERDQSRNETHTTIFSWLILSVLLRFALQDTCHVVWGRLILVRLCISAIRKLQNIIEKARVRIREGEGESRCHSERRIINLNENSHKDSGPWIHWPLGLKTHNSVVETCSGNHFFHELQNWIGNKTWHCRNVKLIRGGTQTSKSHTGGTLLLCELAKINVNSYLAEPDEMDL